VCYPLLTSPRLETKKVLRLKSIWLSGRINWRYPVLSSTQHVTPVRLFSYPSIFSGWKYDPRCNSCFAAKRSALGCFFPNAGDVIIVHPSSRPSDSYLISMSKYLFLLLSHLYTAKDGFYLSSFAMHLLSAINTYKRGSRSRLSF